MKNFLLSLTILFSFSFCMSQTIINGNFEINTLSSCLVNPTNTAYNNVISNSFSFGDYSFSGPDLLKSTCPYGSPANGTWFLGIGYGSQPGVGYRSDAISLEIDMNLVQGNSYTIRYFDKVSTAGGTEGGLIPLQFGLSTESLSFGTLIHSSVPSYSWTERSFTFVAPNNGNFITLKPLVTGTTGSWIHVDYIRIENVLGLADGSFETEIAPFPNPFLNSLTFKLNNNDLSELRIFDITGREIIEKEFTNELTLETFDVNPGLYFYTITSESRIVKKGKILKKDKI
jgi:hypothetical protein